MAALDRTKYVVFEDSKNPNNFYCITTDQSDELRLTYKFGEDYLLSDDVIILANELTLDKETDQFCMKSNELVSFKLNRYKTKIFTA